MTGKERLVATICGKAVDRPAVNFYEIGGFKINLEDPDPFNIYNDPSWRELLRLAEEKTDLIRMRSPNLALNKRRQEFLHDEEYIDKGSRFHKTVISVAGRKLTALSRRDPGINTTWLLEHPLKNVDDLKAYLKLPDEALANEPDISDLVDAEREVGNRGIVMIDTPDPLGQAAYLFCMEEYCTIAFTEPKLFHSLLEKHSRAIYPIVERVASEFPGHLWRICGPEYASEPYLPPRLFDEYVVRYTGPMVEIIKKYGGFVRIHSHGRLRNILPYLVGMGIDGLDPLEPPPQGDMELCEIRREYGRDIVLFGNLEIGDVVNMETSAFEKVVTRSLQEGTAGNGRGFVLMPSAAPYGREISRRTMANYEAMVGLCSEWCLS
ncbi:MAG: uroporphyrinogen decarboxylase family protein [bacterium]|nr:uroporphyrinogen decarboxylase family protein [bacterium]